MKPALQNPEFLRCDSERAETAVTVILEQAIQALHWNMPSGLNAGTFPGPAELLLVPRPASKRQMANAQFPMLNVLITRMCCNTEGEVLKE